MEPFSPEQDPRAFRAALGRFATGVTVITTHENGVPIGITANSFASVSLTPPLVLWSPAKASARHAAFVAAETFNIHILGETQLDICNAFVRSRHGFEDVPHTIAANGQPLIPGCIAAFECTRSAVHEAGDHSIIVGRVTRASQQEGPALVFRDGLFDLPK